uniref:Uncharacterized protein n=1 Tax=Cacopsylla melanoneura TaxID=428564 RepID=A0A8D9BV02_9HEMI
MMIIYCLSMCFVKRKICSTLLKFPLKHLKCLRKKYSYNVEGGLAGLPELSPFCLKCPAHISNSTPLHNANMQSPKSVGNKQHKALMAQWLNTNMNTISMLPIR